ncbi:MAG TPA: DUF1192 domain-containing protein [Alphaproteobacteria bacterium]
MFDDDDRPARPARTIPRNLDKMSIAALEDYIAELEGEIARVRQDISAKQRLQSEAEKVFKSGR